MEKAKSQKGSWIAFLLIAAFLGLVVYLDQTVKQTDQMYMLLTVLQKGCCQGRVGTACKHKLYYPRRRCRPSVIR